ncbi:MAG TPA: hypothetical protein VKC57_06735, partial [Ktedonobacterales bacterium]|nr:hypothetical protein [Ktedonobacterales bacterium]
TFLARVLGGLWLGAGAFILIVAPAVFAAAGTPTSAANVVGAMLSRWHYISLLAPAILLLMEWRGARGRIVAVLFAGVLLAASAAMIDTRIRQIRAESAVPVSSLARTDPVRRRFGMLHGVSSLLLVAQVLAAASLLAMDRDA